jgi:hypothetical protein
VTVATSGFANAVLTVALCPPPLVAARFAAAPAVFVRLKLAGVVAPVAVAVTEYAPAAVFAVNTCEVATPLELVVSVSVAPGVEVANVPLAPVAGAVKVTLTPLDGVPFSVTVAASGFANATPTAALCPPPLVAVIATT